MEKTSNNIKKVFDSAFYSYQNGDLKRAETLFEKVIEQMPKHFSSIFLLGTLSAQIKNYKRAKILLKKAITISPNYAEAQNNLGNVYQELNQFKEAILYYKAAIKINPQYVEAHYNLGKTLQNLEKNDEAIISYSNVIKINPRYIKAHNNLGNIYKNIKKFNEAISFYKKAINVDPNYAEAYYNLANVLRELDKDHEALSYYQTAIKINSNFAEALNNLGNIYQDLDQNQEAINSYQKAIQANPKDFKAYNNLGKVFHKLNLHQKANDCYQEAIKIDPNNLTSHWLLMNNFPIIYKSSDEINLYSKKFEEGILKIKNLLDSNSEYSYQQIINALTSSSNFYLPYQGKDITALQRNYAFLVERLTKLIYPQFQKKIKKNKFSKNIKIGFISSFFKNHSVSKTHINWILKIKANIFETYVYYCGKKFDYITNHLKKHVDYFINETEVQKLINKIVKDDLDILIYLDIGMNPKIQILSSLRLAPIQCNTWGHPVTSGFKYIDYFLSSELMENHNSQRHYTEKLINLPGLGIDYLDINKSKIPKLIALNQPDKTIFLNLQSLYKLHPQDDHIYIDILKEHPNSYFCFVQGETNSITSIFKQRIKKLLNKENIPFNEYFYFHPRCSLDEFLGLIQESEIILDSVNWSGCNTSLDALSLNKPIVTYPSNFMRGRHTYAFLKKLNIKETIAKSKKEYVQIAIKLANNKSFRDSIINKIIKNKSKLFNDEKPIRFLEDFFNKKN